MRSPNYCIKKSADLTKKEIKIIVEHWNIESLKNISTRDFKKKFSNSEFHLLMDNGAKLLSAARVNFNFRVEIQDKDFRVSEFVGFVSIEKMRGYGKELLLKLIQNLTSRNIESIGFCEKHLRAFYEKCDVPILYDKSKHLREKGINEWNIASDDDILNLTLSKPTADSFENLTSDNLGYIFFD